MTLMAVPDLAALGFDAPEPPISLYDYAPVFRVQDRRGDWVVKRTGLVGSSGQAIAAWLNDLKANDVSAVVPARHFRVNPKRMTDGFEWVIYPFIAGDAYVGMPEQVSAAGALLGTIHAVVSPNAEFLVHRDIPVRAEEWVRGHADNALAALSGAGQDHAVLNRSLARQANRIVNLPASGCSADFKASNLVFTPRPILVDPDHAAFMPRLYDLATALLLFHNDLPSAPHRLFTPDEWRLFAGAWLENVTPTVAERLAWSDILVLAWRDQGVWLLGNFPEGWADPSERQYLVALSEFTPELYPLPM